MKGHLVDLQGACEMALLLLFELGCAAVISLLQSVFSLLGLRLKRDSFFSVSFSDLSLFPPVVQSLGFLQVGSKKDLQGYPRLAATGLVHE